MKKIALSFFCFLFTSYSWANCSGSLEFLTPSEIKEVESSSGLNGVSEGYEILKGRLIQMKEVTSIFCDQHIEITTSTSEYDFGRLVGSKLKINVTLLSKIAESKNDSELANLYTFAILGLTGYFDIANKNNSLSTGLEWYRAEASAQIGRTSPLKDYNTRVLKELAQSEPLQAYGMGVYRILTGKDLRIKDYADFEYKKATHPTPYEISNILRNEGHSSLANRLNQLIITYEYDKDHTNKPGNLK